MSKTRTTYVTGSSSTADDNRRLWSGTACNGSVIWEGRFHTLTGGSAGTVEIDDVLPGSNTLWWGVKGRSEPGSITMRFEYSADNSFTDTQLLFEGIVNYGIDVHAFKCMPVVVAPTSPCQYGTRLKGSEAYVEAVGESVLYKWLNDHNMAWLFPILSTFIGTEVDKNRLCGEAPPVVPEITPYILINTGYYSIPILHRVLWDIFCECIPGEPPPTPQPPYEPVRPPGMPDPVTYVLNPTNPCLSLDEVLRKLDTILRTVGYDLQLDTFVQRQLVPTGVARGELHAHLTGAGSWSISACVGVHIVITERIPGRELEGAPNYVWDLGWASIMDDNGFIQERRITRDVEVWFPRLMSDATTFGYFFKEGVTADVTMLHLLP